jgi:hypothetical protein
MPQMSDVYGVLVVGDSYNYRDSHRYILVAASENAAGNQAVKEWHKTATSKEPRRVWITKIGPASALDAKGKIKSGDRAPLPTAFSNLRGLK